MYSAPDSPRKVSSKLLKVSISKECSWQGGYLYQEVWNPYCKVDGHFSDIKGCLLAVPLVNRNVAMLTFESGLEAILNMHHYNFMLGGGTAGQVEGLQRRTGMSLWVLGVIVFQLCCIASESRRYDFDLMGCAFPSISCRRLCYQKQTSLAALAQRY